MPERVEIHIAAFALFIDDRLGLVLSNDVRRPEHVNQRLFLFGEYLDRPPTNNTRHRIILVLIALPNLGMIGVVWYFEHQSLLQTANEIPPRRCHPRADRLQRCPPLRRVSIADNRVLASPA